jgi:excisionase family DNA binding protein
MEEQLLTIEQAADYVGVTQRTIYNWISEGTLGHYRIGEGRAIRIGTDHLRKYLQEHEVTGEKS